VRAGLAQRARIVLLAADDVPVKDIVEQVGVSKPTVIGWKRRYAATGHLFAHACANAKITQSMGHTGSALDNAVSEAFHSTIEFELLAGDGPFATRAQARRAVAGYLDYYNHQRGTPPAACWRRPSTSSSSQPHTVSGRHDQTATGQATGPPQLRPGRYASPS